MLGRSGEPGASKASDSSTLRSSPSDASPERRAEDFDADLGQTVDRIDGESPRGNTPALGERVLFCKLLRDGILKHFNPWKLRDLQCILELRCFKGLLSDDDLKHFFESSVLGTCKFALGDLGWWSESLEELRQRVGEAHQGVENREYDTYPPHLKKVASFTTKEEILREYKMLTYVPTEVYKVAVAGTHVLREVGRLGLLGADGAVNTTSIDKKTATTYLSLACRAGLPASVVSALVTAFPSAYVGDAIEQAAQGNHLDLLDLLLERHGAEVPRNYLLRVVDTADVETVRYLVEHGADIRNHDENGGTLLHWAAGSGNLDVARFLVDEHGADVHARDDDGVTALYLAAGEGKLDMVRFLVDEHGADVHARENDDGRTVLHHAAERGNLDVVRFLVDEHGADVHARENDGTTVLHMAAWNGNLDLVRFLVDEHGADVHARENNGRTVLHWAAYGGNLDVVRFLVEEHGADVHARENDGRTVLHWAAYGGNLDVVRFLVDERGADVHARENDGYTVLHEAAKMGKLEMVRFLVEEHGADVHARNDDGRTVLHDAAGSGKLDVVRFLVDERGADVHARQNDGTTVLHSAAGSGNLNLVRFLVDERGADVHARDDDGATALHRSAYPSCKAFLRDRMERNAPRKRTTTRGEAC